MKEMKKLYLGNSLFVDFNAFAKTAAVAETLRSYVTSSGLVQTLNNYVTTTSLVTQLGQYYDQNKLRSHLTQWSEESEFGMAAIGALFWALQSNMESESYPGLKFASQEYVNDAVSSLTKVTVQKVTTLPATGVENVIYIVPKAGAGSDVHDEYMWISGKWELIGSTAVDLADYATESWVAGQLSPYAKKTDLSSYVTNTSLGTTLGSYVQTATLTSTLQNYETKTVAQSKYTQVTEVTEAQYAAIANKSDKMWYCIVD